MSFSNENTVFSASNFHLISSHVSKTFLVKQTPICFIQERLVRNTNTERQKQECQPYLSLPFVSFISFQEKEINLLARFLQKIEALWEHTLQNERWANVEIKQVTFLAANSMYFSDGALFRICKLFLFYYFLNSIISLTYFSENMLINNIFNCLSKSPVNNIQNSYIFACMGYYFYRKFIEKKVDIDEQNIQTDPFPRERQFQNEELNQEAYEDFEPRLLDNEQDFLTHELSDNDLRTASNSESENQDFESLHNPLMQDTNLVQDTNSAQDTSQSDENDQELFLSCNRPNYDDDDDDDDDGENSHDETSQIDDGPNYKDEHTNSYDETHQSNTESTANDDKNTRNLLVSKESLGQVVDLRDEQEKFISLTKEITLQTFPSFFPLAAFQWKTDHGTRRIAVHLENQVFSLMFGVFLHNIVAPLFILFLERQLISFFLSCKVIQFPIQMLWSYTNNFWLAKNCFILLAQLASNINCKKNINFFLFLLDRVAKNILLGFFMSNTIFPFYYDWSIIDTIHFHLIMDLLF